MNILYSLVLSVALSSPSGDIQVHEYVVDYNLSEQDCAFYVEQHGNDSLSCKAQIK